MKYPPQSGEPQLFDLRNDPGENVNLATENPELVKRSASFWTNGTFPSNGRLEDSRLLLQSEKDKETRHDKAACESVLPSTKPRFVPPPNNSENPH